MGKKTEIADELNLFFGKRELLTLEDLRLFFRRREPELPDATINWRIHDMINSDIISRIGRGKYQLGTGTIYRPEISSRVMKISKFLKKNFPLINYCVWDTALLNEFAHHLTSYHFIMVDVERDVAESTYYRLKEEFNGVFLQPSERILNDIMPSFKLPIAIRNLATESPLAENEQIPVVTIEKLLVDIFCDPEFSYLAGSELRSIFRNAYYKYTVNNSKLFRYAARKGRRMDVQQYVVEGRFENQKNQL